MKQKKKWLILAIVIGILLIGAGVTAGVLFLNRDRTEDTDGKKKKEEKEIDVMLAALTAGYSKTDSEADTDGDGIQDGEEERLGLNKFSADTDGDGLDDLYERTVSRTDPLSEDTDGDGLLDGEELLAGLDPKEKCSDGKEDDRKRLFEREVALEGGTLSIEGAANIYSLYTGLESESGLSALPGIYGEVHEFYLKGREFESATLTLTYDAEQARRQGYTPETLLIYQVSEQLELLPVACKNDGMGTVIAELEHFSMYALADSTVAEASKTETPRPKVAILIDNSGSMYDMEGSDANDPEMKRLALAKQIVADSKDSCDFFVSKFTASYRELTSEWTNDEEVLNAAIDGINENENFNGTYINNAVIQTTEKFEKENNGDKRYIILLTDGATTESGLFCYELDDATKRAVAKGITVITIGLGSKVDANYLTTLSEDTGGFYIYANVADALECVNERITTGMNYNYVDADDDGEFDYVSVADSGFNVKRDGFSFKNYYFFDGTKVVEGQCYGMNLFAQLYYLGKLPISRESFQGPDYYGNSYDFSEVPGYEGETDLMSNKVPLYEKYKFTRFDSFNQSTGQWKRDTTDESRLALTDVWKRYIEDYPLFVLKEVPMDAGFVWSDGKEASSGEVPALTFIDVDDTTLTGNDREIYELIRALNNLMACQDTENIEKIDMCYGIKWEDSPTAKRERFETIIQKVREGIPLIIGSPNHVANVTRIERSVANPSEYRLYLYDSNYPGEEFIITVRKEKSISSLLKSEGDDVWDYAFYDTDGVFGNKGERIDFIELYYWKDLSK